MKTRIIKNYSGPYWLVQFSQDNSDVFFDDELYIFLFFAKRRARKLSKKTFADHHMNIKYKFENGKEIK